MSKLPNFNKANYSILIEELKKSGAASIPVTLNLDGQDFEVTAPFNASCAPKNPIITLENQCGEVYFFNVQDQESGFQSNLLVKYSNLADNQAVTNFDNDYPYQVGELENKHSDFPARVFRLLDYKEKINYCNVHKMKISYKLGNFVLTTQTSGDESDHTGNVPSLKNNSKTFFEGGSIFFSSDGKIASGSLMIYVVDKNGVLYVSPSSSEYGCVHHSYILKSKIADDKLYGYGKPTASAGHITINNEGKITEIDNGSGHYFPNFEQTLLVTKYFKQFGIMDEASLVKNSISAEAVSYTDIDYINTEEILGRYLDISDINI